MKKEISGKINRITAAFSACKKAKRPTRIIYTTSGYPDLAATTKVVLELEKSGVDIVELGFPFSDPMADGPVIQTTTQYSLQKGYKTDDHFETVRKIRRKTEIPLAIMTYVNIVFGYGMEKFIRKAAACGIDGLIIPDLPLEEMAAFNQYCGEAGIVTVGFVSTTSSDIRLKNISAASTGFIYVVSQPGVTGKKLTIRKDLVELARKLRKLTAMPLAVGFGIQSKEDVRDLSLYFDGVIIGSAFLKKMLEAGGKTVSAIKFVKSVFE